MNRHDESREAFRAQLVARIPRWYSPWAHLILPGLVGLGVMAAAILMVDGLRAIELLAIPATWVFSNAFEWRVHRDLLHRRIPGFRVLYDRHTPEHHRVFVTGDMAMRSSREFRLVLIPAYGVLGIAALDTALASAAVWLGAANVGWLFLATSMFYTLSYEWLHLAYHLPADHPIGRLGIIRRLRRHHAIHHAPSLMQRWNFNVTVPLWDWVRRTIYPWRERTDAPEVAALLAAERGAATGRGEAKAG